MIVAEVMGVGLFLTPAGMARTAGATGWAWILGVWVVVGLLSVAGALCFAELGSRFPEAGGGYVFLREAFGERTAFVYGWMALLVMDPGLTAALGVGLARYVLVALDGPAALVPIVAVGSILVLAGISVLGLKSSSRLLRWTVLAKVAAIVVLLVAVLIRRDDSSAAPVVTAGGGASFGMLAGALMGAFFALGGWWDLGKMSEEIVNPRRTLPIALVGGIIVVTVIYAQLSLAFIHALAGRALQTDEEFVSALGATLFGSGASRILAAVVIVAVAGSLAAVLLGAPRVYLAMARSGVFPSGLVRFHPTRQSAGRATLIQVVLACTLVTFGTFDQIIGYFVPIVVLFLGLSAAAILVLPRPRHDATVFRTPWHPLPIVLFLVLVVVTIVLFTMGRPMQTLIGAGVVALGIPASFFVLKPRRAAQGPAALES